MPTPTAPPDPAQRGLLDPRADPTLTRGADERWWQLRSLRDRMMLPFALLLAVVAVFIYAYFPGAVERQGRASLRERAEALAAVVASAVAPVVAAGDTEELARIVEHTTSASDVAFVRVVDGDGRTLEESAAGGLERHDEENPGGGVALTRAVATIRGDDAVLGTVELFLPQTQLHDTVVQMRATAGTVALFILALGLLALLVMGRVVTGPVLAIAAAAERIRDGDLEARAPVVSTDEVGRLASAFNVMVDRLESSRKELRSWAEELESRVAERTRELEEVTAQRLRAEEERSEIERFYEQVLDALPLEVAVFDLEQRYVYLNPASVEQPERRFAMLGATPEAAGVREIVGDEVFQARQAAMERACRTGCLVSQEERRTDADGTERTYIRVFSPMLSPRGEVMRIVSYGVDVTDRKAVEAALHESEARLRQSQKMEAVGRLAGGIAHDFNNLLTVITGHAELVMMGMDESHPDFQEINQMKKAAEQAATLTRQLLAFSRRQVLQPQLLSVNQVVEGVERMLSRLIGEHIVLTTDLGSGLGKIEADPGQLEQVLMNLAVNARDAMPDGGHLSIITEQASREVIEERWGHPVTPGEYVVISVRDTGSGIDPEHLEYIFEPFFTTKEIGQGTGLGLATVYGIVKQSGGFIYVDSTKGVGTTFRVLLPVSREGASARMGGPGLALAHQLAKGSETILLVEDEEMVRRLTHRILERAGYRVLTAEGPERALEIVRTHPGPIHLLFTDVVMPGMAGTELAERALEIRGEMKVLYMSGYTDDALLNQGVLENGVVLLQKPFTTERATHVVRAVLDGEEPSREGTFTLTS